MKLSYGKSQDDFRRPFHISSAILLILFAVLVFRLWHLQILNGQKWFAFSEENRITLKTIPAVRGRIFDRDQTLIAESKPAYDLMMTPNKTSPDVESSLASISALIDWDLEAAQKSYDKNRHPNLNRSFALKKNLSRDEVATIQANRPRLDGFDVEVVPTRTYVYPGSANHLLGRMGEIGKEDLEEINQEQPGRYRLGDFWGVSGIEQRYEKHLRGFDGVRPVLEDVWGRSQEVPSTSELLPSFKEKKSIPGSDIYLTIDMELQILASELLDGKKGSIVAMDPRSGEILVMESSPTFIGEYFARGVDNSYWRSLIMDPDKPLYDRSVQALYPPASTFKIVPALAALMEEVTDPKETVFCPGHYRLGREVKRCWKRSGHGYVDLAQAIKYSCDVYFYEMAKRMGIEALAKYSRMLGLGEKTGIDFAKEAKGLVPDDAWKQRVYGEPWVGGETLSVGIGQGALLTTNLQLAVLYSTFINGGTVVVPQVLLGIRNNEGQTHHGFERKERKTTPLDADKLEPIMDGLRRVVQEKGGTAYWYANSKKIPIAGKTGTAQVVALDSGLDIKDHAWFVGYAPSEAPQIVVSVIVEHGDSGSVAASPLVKHILEKHFESETGL